MDRFTWGSCLVLVLLVVRPAAADSVRVILHLEGTLSERGGRFTLDVEGEGGWTIELAGFDREVAKECLRQNPKGKVSVSGGVSAWTAGTALQLRDRTVHDAVIAPLVPAVQVETILPGTPAAGNLQVGDFILEVQGTKITSYEQLLQTLDRQRGKRVSLEIERDGRPKILEDVALRAEGPALGIQGKTGWMVGVGGGQHGGTEPHNAPPAASGGPSPLGGGQHGGMEPHSGNPHKESPP